MYDDSSIWKKANDGHRTLLSLQMRHHHIKCHCHFHCCYYCTCDWYEYYCKITLVSTKSGPNIEFKLPVMAFDNWNSHL